VSATTYIRCPGCDAVVDSTRPVCLGLRCSEIVEPCECGYSNETPSVENMGRSASHILRDGGKNGDVVDSCDAGK
jgi:hypothetical protein